MRLGVGATHVRANADPSVPHFERADRLGLRMTMAAWVTGWSLLLVSILGPPNATGQTPRRRLAAAAPERIGSGAQAAAQLNLGGSIQESSEEIESTSHARRGFLVPVILI